MCSAFIPSSLGFNVRVSRIEQPSNIGTGNTLYVGGSGPDNYTTIQSAIDDAVDGDTIYVYSGTYYEYNRIIDKSINLIGENKYNTIINGNAADHDVIIIISDDVLIRGFTIIGIREYKFGDIGDACIQIESINNIIENNIFIKSYSGVYISRGNYQNVGPNLIRNNIFDNQIGVFIDETRYCTVENCNFIRNEGYGDWGIYIRYSSHNKILNCSFYDDGFIWVADGEYNLIENCNLSNYNIRFHFACDGNIIKNCRIDSPHFFWGIDYYHSGKDNIVQDTIITNCLYHGIHVREDHKNFKLINCTIIGCENGVEFAALIGCLVSNCKFLNNRDAGIRFSRNLRNGKVTNCHFENNKYGIEMNLLNYFNRFSYNNFMNIDSNFYYNNYISSKLMFNFYYKNYWNDWNNMGFYHIWGLINWDFFPAKEPYDI